MAKPIPSTICGYEHTSSRQDLSHIKLGRKIYGLSDKQRKRLRHAVNLLETANKQKTKRQALKLISDAMLLLKVTGRELSE